MGEEAKPAGDGAAAETGAKPAEGEGAKPADGAGTGAATSESGKPAAEGDKGADGKKTGDDGKPAGEAPAKPVAPEQYADLKLPDGATALFGDAGLKTLEAQCRAAGMSNDDAQAALETVLVTLDAQAKRFLAETTADATYGGTNLGETQRLANKALDTLRPAGHPQREALLTLLRQGGVINNLQVVSFLADLGRRMGEDTGVGGRVPAGGDTAKTLDERAMAAMYPKA